MIAALEAPRIEYPLDENGVAIRKGYRPPFIKGGFDPRRYVPPKGPRSKQSPRAISILLAATRRAFKRHTTASFSAISTVEGMRHAKMAKLFFDIERELLGHKSSRANSTKNHSLRLSEPMAKVAPISTVKTPTITPQSIDQNAPQVKPGGKVSPVSSDSDSDCPF